MSALVLVTALLVGPPADQGAMTALAASSGRPKECTPLSRKGKRVKKLTVWQRIRYPKVAEYCDLVSRAQTSLEGDPKASLEAAEGAAKVWAMPGADVARGRALFALGKTDEALAAFAAARKADASALEDPKALRDLARALAKAGKFSEAAAEYRVLVPRAELLSDRARVEVLLEAAFASMAAEGALREQPAPGSTLGEALAFLSEARQEEASPHAGEVLLALALVHDRRGDPSKATALTAEAAKAGAGKSAAPWVADPADRHALAALALEPRDAAGAQKAWAAYVEAAEGGAWVDAAKARQTLKGKPAPLPKKPPRKKP
jgi:tetratricopeptide (TPR) repeat protein